MHKRLKKGAAMKVPLLYTVLMIGFVLDVVGMERSGKHDRTQSMPVVLHGSKSDELVLLAADMEEGRADQEFVRKCRSALDRLSDQCRPATCAEVAATCCKTSGRWVGDHRGTLMLLAACGALSFYAGTQIVRMTNTCGAAQDTCSDAITECGTAMGLLHVCTSQVMVLSDFIKIAVSNGTQTVADTLEKCLATAGMVRETYELCKLCKGGIPAPAGF